MRPTGLSENGIVLMAALLGLTDERPGLTDERPGLKAKPPPNIYGTGTREAMRGLDRAYVDDYGAGNSRWPPV